jgi:endo-1,4-beta-xylanase
MKPSSRIPGKFSLTRLMSRRQAIKVGLGSLAALTVLSLGKLEVLSYIIDTFKNDRKIKESRNRTFKVVGTATLKKRAKAKGIIYGAFPQVGNDDFKRNPKWKSLFVRECGLIVAGTYWDQTRPSVNAFDFQETDSMVKFAFDHKMLVRGHPLVWYNAPAKWMKETINSQNAEQILTNHIQTVVGRYAGKMHSWDVVNEAIELKNGRSELRKDLWSQFIGPDYIEKSFRIAAQADPKALLVYNETDLEYSDVHQTAVLKLLEKLKSTGTPVQALGIQSHLDGRMDNFNPQQFRKFLKNVADLGLKIMITELDVIDQHLPLDINKRDRLIAGVYEDYLTTVLSEKAVIAVINWGLSDRYTWINKYIPRKDRSPSRPLPFDRDMQPKLAWNGISRALDRSPKR